MKQTFLEFEQPIAELEAKIEELRYVQDDSALDISEEITRLQKKSNSLTKEIYAKLNAVADRAGRAPPAAAVHARLRARLVRRVSRSCTAIALFATMPRSSAGSRASAADGDGDRPSERPRHQGEAVPQFRHAASRKAIARRCGS